MDLRNGPAGADQISELMNRLRGGDSTAAKWLVEIFYSDLRRLASSRMRNERVAHTWQPTALVNELYLELVKIRELKDVAENRSVNDKAAFLALAGHIMRRLLLSHIRPLAYHVDRANIDCVEESGYSEQSLHDVELLLSQLANVDPTLRRVVELRVFGGLTGDEIATQLHVSPRSVARYWKFAQAWLADALSGSTAGQELLPGR